MDEAREDAASYIGLPGSLIIKLDFVDENFKRSDRVSAARIIRAR